MNGQLPVETREDLTQLFLCKKKKTVAAMLHTATATYFSRDQDNEEPAEKKLERINSLLELREQYINEINQINIEMLQLADLPGQSPPIDQTRHRLKEYPEWQAYQKEQDETLDLLSKTREFDHKLSRCLEDFLASLSVQLKELHLKRSGLKSYEAAGDQLKGCFVNQKVF